MRYYEEVIRPLCTIPVGPEEGDVGDGSPHHAGGTEGEWEAMGGEVTGGVDGSVEPVSFLRVHGASSALQNVPMENHLRCKHVREAAGVSLDELLVVFGGHVVDIHLDATHRIGYQNASVHICSA